MYEFYIALGALGGLHEACAAWDRSRRCGTPAHHGVLVGWCAGRAPADERYRPDYLRYRQGQLRLAAGRDHWVEQALSRPEGHSATATRGVQRSAGPTGREPRGQERRV